MGIKEVAAQILTKIGYPQSIIDQVDTMSNQQIAGLIDTGVSTIVGEWTETQPELPPRPWVEGQLLAFWRVRLTRLNLNEGVMRIFVLADEAYGTVLANQEGGTVEAYQRFQVRDGKLWGRAGAGEPYDLESTGWEYAGYVPFPPE